MDSEDQRNMGNEERNAIFNEIIKDLKNGMDELEFVSMEEQVAFDNIEEYFPGSQRALDMEEGLLGLDEAIRGISDLVSRLEDMASD